MLGNSYVPLSEIITAAAQELRVPEFGSLGRPFFESCAQRAITEMNYATNFHKREFRHVLDRQIIELPSDLTEKDQCYLYRGDECNVVSSTILFIKPNMQSLGGEGYIAQNKGWNRDPMQWSLSWSEQPPHCLYFAGERNGKLYLSPSCFGAFDYLYIQYTGIGVDCFGEDFKVPMWAREAVTDFVIEKAARAMWREDPQFLRQVINDKKAELTSPKGSWHTAIWRYKRSDSKRKYDTEAYSFRTGHFP